MKRCRLQVLPPQAEFRPSVAACFMSQEPVITSPTSLSSLDEASVFDAATVVRGLLNLRPSDQVNVGVILGSGLGAAADRLLASGGASIPYSNIPGMPVPHVIGHPGRLVHGRIEKTQVIMLQGRVHSYEGHSLEAIVFGARLLSQLGVTILIVTNAAGGISPHFTPGDLMLIRSHLRPLTAEQLNIGWLLNQSRRQSDIPQQLNSFLWNPQLRIAAKSVTTDLRIHEGVYAMMTGPAYETPAEIRMLRHLGADAVGMSTVPEAMFAASRGIAVLGISCITNVAAGLSEKPLDHRDVTATASTIEAQFVDWLWKIVPRLIP